MKKRKRFYKNIKRGGSWTEEETGRPIDFADKYIAEEGVYSDKFDYMRPKVKKKRRRKAQARTLFKRLGIAALCLAVMGVGYTAMDVYMIRNSMPNLASAAAEQGGVMNEMRIDLHGAYEDSISLDGSVILESVAESLAAGGYNSVAFDIKRADGTIGYRSALATVNAYSAAAYEAADLRSSAAQLAQQDILTVGVVCCYQDDLIPRRDRALALLDRNGVPLEDSQGRTYLNPQSETVYKYLKDIISEARDMGVSIFLLRGTETPSEGGEYTEHFDELCRRLYADLGTDIKLLRPIDVQVSSSLASRLAGEEDEEKDEEDSQSSYQGGEPTGAAAELLELFDGELSNDSIYVVHSESGADKIKQILEEGGTGAFILDAEQL